MSSLSTTAVHRAFSELGKLLGNPSSTLMEKAALAQHQNAWFTKAEIDRALTSYSEMLNPLDLENWLQTVKVTAQPKKVGLILAGNIPLVGLHDVLCVLATGNIALIKPSSSDDKLIPAVLNELTNIEPAFADQIKFVERLENFDAVIATGSNNSSRYFDYYFSKVPNIIRKNRNSVAILTGNEPTAEIEKLGHDIFDYFGLGCRNVSKIYIPENYEVAQLFKPLEKFNAIIHHFKYNNNYDYNKSILLVNGVNHYDNGFLLLKADESLSSPLAVLHFETYSTMSEAVAKIDAARDQIQCVVCSKPLGGDYETVAFGQSQHPKIDDYADDLNTITFLAQLHN